MSVLNAMKDMKSKRIKIIVTLLAVAAIAAAFVLRPKHFNVDRTNYEFISLHQPEYQSSEVCALNRSGVAVGRVRYPDGKFEMVKWHSDGTRDIVPVPEDLVIIPHDINEEGTIVGSYLREGSPERNSFRWDSVRGFQFLPVCETFQFDYSEALSINNKGQIVGFMTNRSPRKNGIFIYDPVDGFSDIGNLGLSVVGLGGINDNGMIVGTSKTTGNVTHAFLWAKQVGMTDIHSAVAPQAVSTSAFAISSDGWILVGSYDQKGKSQIIRYHTQKGIVSSLSFKEWIWMGKAVSSKNQFVLFCLKPSWKIGKITLHPDEYHNWILDYNQDPVLITPKALSGKLWDIVDMDDQGIIVGNLSGNLDAPKNQPGNSQAFLLRPIRPADPARK
jgi:probable HAF family extracellular repeat protein